MTNREKILNTNIYDFLCKLYDSLPKECILDLIDDNGHICDGSCKECIAKWLNEERA